MVLWSIWGSCAPQQLIDSVYAERTGNAKNPRETLRSTNVLLVKTRMTIGKVNSAERERCSFMLIE